MSKPKQQKEPEEDKQSIALLIGGLFLTSSISLGAMWVAFYFNKVLSCDGRVIFTDVTCDTAWALLPMWVTAFVVFLIPAVIFFALLNVLAQQ